MALNSKKYCHLVLILLAASARAPASILLHSSFDSDTEGWSVGAFFGTPSVPLTAHEPNGGRSGGYLATTDQFGNNAFRAPSGWLGNQTRLFGGRLRFYQRASESDGLVAPMVVLAGNSLILQFRAAPPTSDWTEFSVLLNAGAWEIGDGSGDASAKLASDEQILGVLGDLQWIAFSADWKAGEDLVGLDEVSITDASVPEPSSLTAVAGLAAVAMAVARRRG